MNTAKTMIGEGCGVEDREQQQGSTIFKYNTQLTHSFKQHLLMVCYNTVFLFAKKNTNTNLVMPTRLQSRAKLHRAAYANKVCLPD